MAKTDEMKIAEALANATEAHWFNPATLGRYLADQPIYTVDRVMELVIQIVHYQNRKFEEEKLNGRTSEGLLLAKDLYKTINLAKKKREHNSIKFPITKI